MQIRFSLPRRLDFMAIQRLLPALLRADSVVLDAALETLLCQCDSAELGAVEETLERALSALGPAWAGHSSEHLPREPDLALYALSDAVLTVIAPPGVDLPGELTALLAEWDLDLRALRRLSPRRDAGETALELYLDPWERCQELRPRLRGLAQRWGIDLSLAPADSKRPRRRLIAFDMDSTLIRCEVIDELAARAGVGAEVAAVTERAMRGELDFPSSFRERLARLEGLREESVHDLASALPLMPGAAALLRTLRALGHYTVILSGGFELFARRLQTQLGFDEAHANALQIDAGRVTGRAPETIIDATRKAELLTQIAGEQGFALADTVAVGDGANDLLMLARAGVGVAYHAKPIVQEQAQQALCYSDLEALLYLLGVPRRDP